MSGSTSSIQTNKREKKIALVLKNLLQSCSAYLNGKSVRGWGKLRQDTAHQ